MRINGSIEIVPVLVAIGVIEMGHRPVLGPQAGDKEWASIWREFFKDLRKHALDSRKVILGIMHGLPGLEKVFKEEFSQAQAQHCTIHVAPNVLGKVPEKPKQAMADNMPPIFYASSKEVSTRIHHEFQSCQVLFAQCVSIAIMSPLTAKVKCPYCGGQSNLESEWQLKR